MSTTIKFVYVRWNGCDVAFTMRGKYGVVHGSIEKEFTVSQCRTRGSWITRGRTGG